MNFIKKLLLFFLFLSSLFGANAEYFIKDNIKQFRSSSEFFDNHSQYISFMKLYVSSSFSVEVGDEFGIFVEDSSSDEYGILIGSYKIESNDMKESKADEIDIVCFMSSDDNLTLKDGAFSDDTLYYKFYDKSTGSVYKALSGSDITFTKGGLVSPSFKETSLVLSDEIESETISPLSLSTYSKDFILGSSSSYDVLISGGLAPYSASYDINIVDVTINGSILNITPLSTGSTEIIVSDSASSQKNIDISVSVESFSISTNAIEFDLNSIVTTDVIINGGVEPYSISNISNSIVSTNLNSDTLSITPTVVGSTFVTISDSMANSQIVAITIIDSSSSSNNSGNNAPIISSILFSEDEVLESDSVTINIVASDSDGDTLTTICSSKEGSVTNLNNISTFRAPFVSSDKYVEITCFTSDSKVTTSKTASIRVIDIPTNTDNSDDSNDDDNEDSENNNNDSSNSTNYSPTISQIYSGFTEINENSSISILIIASDLNEDDLIYSCSSSIGEIEPLNENSITFLSPNVIADVNVTIICSVSDGNTLVYQTKELKIKNIKNSLSSTDDINSDSENSQNDENGVEDNNFYEIGFITYNIKNGWNLIGNSSNKEIGKEFFKDIFSKDVEIYTFFNNSWFNFSNQDTINILPRQGFWLKSLSSKDYNITLDARGDGSAEFVTPTSGWSLMAVINNNLLIEIKNSFNASKIWRYDNNSKTWFNAIENPTHNLKIGDGYWVFIP